MAKQLSFADERMRKLDREDPEKENEMKMFIGVKMVTALAMTRLEYNVYRDWVLPSDENGADEGFLVEYPNGSGGNHPDHEGYISWCPKAQFEEANRACDAMPFGHAIEAARKGLKIARAGWNGKGMFLFISCPGSKEVAAENIWSEHGRKFAEENGGTVTVLPYLLMKTADDCIVPWLASQTDMLADDWQVVG